MLIALVRVDCIAHLAHNLCNSLPPIFPSLLPRLALCNDPFLAQFGLQLRPQPPSHSLLSHPLCFPFHSSIIRVVQGAWQQCFYWKEAAKGNWWQSLTVEEQEGRPEVWDRERSQRWVEQGRRATRRVFRHRCARAGGENAERGGRIYKGQG